MMSALSHEPPLFAHPIDWIIPVRPALRGLGRLRPALRLLIVAGTLAAVTALAVSIALMNAASKAAASTAAHRFAAALVEDRPGLAPPGAAAYVPAIQAQFGAVHGARLLEVRNHSVNSANTADERTFAQADLWLRTARGPVAIELAFDNHSLSGNSQAVSGVSELGPEQAPNLGVTERSALIHAVRARGDHAGALDPTAGLPAAAPVTPAAHASATPVATQFPVVHPAVPAAIRCVHAAHGDVAKLAACSGR